MERGTEAEYIRTLSTVTVQVCWRGFKKPVKEPKGGIYFLNSHFLLSIPIFIILIFCVNYISFSYILLCFHVIFLIFNFDMSLFKNFLEMVQTPP